MKQWDADNDDYPIILCIEGEKRLSWRLLTISRVTFFPHIVPPIGDDTRADEQQLDLS